MNQSKQEWAVYMYPDKNALMPMCAVSGLGKHKRTLDFNHSERAAKKHAKACNKSKPEWSKVFYKAEPLS